MGTLWVFCPSDTPEQVGEWHTSGATAVFNIIPPKMESRPIELHSEEESEARVEEKAVSHHQTWDALVFRRQRLRGADWVLRQRKTNELLY